MDISVIVVTYNHQDYIKYALESILQQKFNGEIEILIGDDFSSDNTVEILKYYKNSYPKKIKLFDRKSNIGCINNYIDLIDKCKGKYIAILEGDDFWNDNYKLKKQFEFLEINSNYIGCSSRYNVVDMNNQIIQDEYVGPGRPLNNDYTISDFENYIYIGHISTWMFKNNLINPTFNYLKNINSPILDIALNLILALYGKIFIYNEVLASYRLIQDPKAFNYVSSIKRKNGIPHRIKYLNNLKSYSKNYFKTEINFTNRNGHYKWWSLLFLLRYPSVHNLKAFYFVYKISFFDLNSYIYLIKKFLLIPIKILSGKSPK